MLISSVFILILASILYTINAGVVVATSENPTPAPVQDHEIAGKLNDSHKLNTIEHKLTMIDTTLQNLNEQAHTWAIFRHHIDAWNDQMKSIEHKLDLVKRTQDEQQTIQVKLTSFEFTLNHILSKLVLLSDTRPSPEMAEFQRCNREPTAVVSDADREDKKWKNEIATRLGNILRHVQNIEHDNDATNKNRNPNQNHHKKNKADNLMMPVREHKNKHNNDSGAAPNLERSLRAIDQKLTLFAQHFSPKEFKQMHTLSKKNGKTLESILEYVANTDRRLTDWSGELNANMEQCQEISNELTTFTASSDLLLKKIEKLVHNVKTNQVNGTGGEVGIDRATVNNDRETHEEGVDEEEPEEDETTPEQDKAEVEADDDSATITEAENSMNVVYVAEMKTGCHELLEVETKVDGVYKFATPQLNDADRDFNTRYCLQIADDRVPWTVIQNRGPYGEHENFNRSWSDYRNGFGELHREFWFGNEFVHQLVYRDDYALRVELEDFGGQRVWAEYTLFRVDSERYNYNLLIDGYSGNVPDAMHYNNEMDFSTFDRRNDRSVDACCSCAAGYASGWWYDNCSEANLNGVYHDTPNGHNYVGVMWELWRGDYSLKRARMMIRPTQLVARQSAEVENDDDDEHFSEDP